MFRNPRVSKFLFLFANYLLVFSIYRRYDDPLSFAFLASGLIIFSFFLMRGIQQVVN